MPSPWSIYKNIFKVPPAHYTVIGNQGKTISKPICYWDLKTISSDGVNYNHDPSADLEEELDILLRESVGRRMLSDVPLGAFLSGGIDSSMVVAQMQAQSSTPIKTFTIGFGESSHNEAQYAKKIATQFRNRTHRIICNRR